MSTNIRTTCFAFSPQHFSKIFKLVSNKENLVINKVLYKLLDYNECTQFSELVHRKHKT